MPTPHNSAKLGAFAQVVLMPGDPLRAKYIADNFLEHAALVNNVRGVQGYTGIYKGTVVSVMASGMGMPSMGIYSHELFHDYGVECIIRIGSAGSISPKLKLRDIVVGMGACTNSNYMNVFNLPGTFCPIADYEVLSMAMDEAKKMGITPTVGNLSSEDNFYNTTAQGLEAWRNMGVLALEMEAAALYANAAHAGKRGLALCTISDDLVKDEHLAAEERQSSFDEMVTLALNTAKTLCAKLAKEANQAKA